MKFSTAVLLTGAAVASAQSISQLVGEIPSCALPCFISSVPKVCPSGITDYACQCSHQSQLTTLLQPCIISKCGAQKGLTVQSVSNQICSVEKKMGGGASSAAASSMPASSMAAMSTPMASSMAAASTPAASMASSMAAMSTPMAAASTPAASMASATPTAYTGAAGPMATAGPAAAALAGAVAFFAL